ncbi:MAG: YhfC family glutamic-type intramembrane protease [Oscillospiraceae bacterium]|nr:YhfC family glutamic-type intramembrane protease [Oscillospiraceae bacterium]
MIPTLSIAFMGFDILLAVALPVGMFLYFRKKHGCDRLPFLVGCAVMLVFAFVLEQLAHSVILGSPLGQTIQANPVLLALYGGLMAGLFEESGRLIAFKTVLKRRQSNDKNALMYGAGHGGFEAFVILGISMVNNLVYAVLYNTGNAAVLTAGMTAAQTATVQAAFAQLTSTSPWLFLVSAAERLAAVAAQLSLSVLVWFAAKKGGKSFWLYPLAIGLHFALDAVAALLNSVLPSVLLVELGVVLFAALCVYIAVRVWRKNAAPAAQTLAN